MTRQEVKLWIHLRSWKDRGFHFRRQAAWGHTSSISFVANIGW
jgi:very-short-patch-repair endonuclease